MLNGPGWGQCSKEEDCSNIKLSWRSISEVQKAVIQSSFLEDQDINDIDGPDFFIINSNPPENPLQYSVSTITIVFPFTFQAHMNKQVIDLPPPSLS